MHLVWHLNGNHIQFALNDDDDDDLDDNDDDDKLERKLLLVVGRFISTNTFSEILMTNTWVLYSHHMCFMWKD